MAFSQMVENKLLLRYDDDISLVYPDLNTLISNDDVYDSAQAIGSLQEKNLTYVGKLSTYFMFS